MLEFILRSFYRRLWYLKSENNVEICFGILCEITRVFFWVTGDFSKSQFVHVVELSQHLISNNCLICVFFFSYRWLDGNRVRSWIQTCNVCCKIDQSMCINHKATAMKSLYCSRVAVFELSLLLDITLLSRRGRRENIKLKIKLMPYWQADRSIFIYKQFKHLLEVCVHVLEPETELKVLVCRKLQLSLRRPSSDVPQRQMR